MKTIIAFLPALLPALPGLAQDWEPRETWPFVYESFQPGAVQTRDGALTELPCNIALADGALMYLDAEEVILRADMLRVHSARIGEDAYLNVSGRMYRVLSETECGRVLLGREIDLDRRGEVRIGYGISSSTASAQGVSILMDGRFDTVNRNLQQTEADKYRGEVLPVKELRCLLVGGRLIPATRQAVLDLPGIDRKAAVAFFKQERIRWRETSSLEKVLRFVSERVSP